jgi:hypothetical protein
MRRCRAIIIPPEICDTAQVATTKSKFEFPLLNCQSCGTELACVGCGTPLKDMDRKALRALAGHLLSVTRTADMVRGKEKVLRPCKWCKKKFGAVEMREHRPKCPKRPKTAPVGRAGKAKRAA